MLAQRQWINQARTKKISHQLVFIYENSVFYFQSWCQAIYMESKVLATRLTLGMQMRRRVKERKRGLGCWMNDPSCRICPPPSQLGLLGSLTPVRHAVSHPASQSRLIQSLGTWYVRDFVDWGGVVWGFDAATCELNLCLLGACAPRSLTSRAHWQLAQIHW